MNICGTQSDDLNREMLGLLVERFFGSKEVGCIKAVHNINVGDPNREREIVDRLAEKLEGQLDRDDITAIFGTIYHISKKIQKKYNKAGSGSFQSLISTVLNNLNPKNYYSWYWFFIRNWVL